MGIGNYNETIEEIILMNKIKPDAFLLGLPSYIKPNINGLVAFVKKCALNSSVPIILYYVPSRSGQYLTAKELLLLLNAAPNIVGLKFADDNLPELAEIVRQTNKTILCGEDGLLEEFLKLGAKGAISVASNAFPQLVVNFVNSFKSEDSLAYINYCKCKTIIKSLFLETNPVLIKHLLNLMGHNVGQTRPPLAAPSEANKDIIKEELFKLRQQKLV